MASEDIQAALETHLSSLPMEAGEADPGIIGDWIAVVSMVAVDDEGQPRAEYYLLMRGGNMLPHVAKGLLAEGLDQVDSRLSEE